MNTGSIVSACALAALLAVGVALPVGTAQAEKARMGSDGGHRSGGRADDGGARGPSGGARQDSGSRGRFGSYRDDGNRDRYERSYHTRDGYRGNRDRYRYFDNRYDHGRYYPARGYYVDTLPRHYHVIHHHRHRYYYGDGIWYRPYGHRYVVARPAIGLYVSVLPAYATTVWFGSDPYYYANDVYYAWRPSRRVYEVVDPPSDRERSAPADDPEDVYVYPREGQSPEQQDRDRYECHRWAVDQTGFDPSAAGGGVDRDDRADRREDYSRALAACLDGRGYTVR